MKMEIENLEMSLYASFFFFFAQKSLPAQKLLLKQYN